MPRRSQLDMATSTSMALTFAGASSRTSSTSSSSRQSNNMVNLRPHSVMGFSRNSGGAPTDRPQSASISLYKGVSNRPFGWKAKGSLKVPAPGKASRDAHLKRWDGTARVSSDWDAIKRDPELWFRHGDCFVHLYGPGQSARGPSFKVPFDILVEAGCRPLLERFLVENESPSATSSSDAQEYFERKGSRPKYDLYMPAPPSLERAQAMLYHVATRNFFAWICGRPLVGAHLGGALVGLFNSMNEFRSEDVDNEMDILDYMDEEGYSDMRNAPSHAMATLYFAEHFHFRDIWIDSFAHCVGMNDQLFESSEYEFISRISKTLISRARFELDLRLDDCTQRLGNWLEDELSASYLGLPPSCRTHLDRFRAFLQSYYVAKFGYYPPSADANGLAGFSKGDLCAMRREFEMLYDFLADESVSATDDHPFPIQPGLCVMQNILAFDQRLRFQPLPYPLPLVPEEVIQPAPVPVTKRMSWRGIAPDKMQLDPRLANLNSLMKATNRNPQLMSSPLVSLYRSFEKDVIFSAKAEKTKISPSDGRKVRWIMVYAILQTLRAVTNVPDEVRDIDGVPYHLSVLTAGCPPWKDDQQQVPYKKFLKTQHEQMSEDWDILSPEREILSPPPTANAKPRIFSTLQPDIDYRQQPVRMTSESSLITSNSISNSFAQTSPKRRIGTVRRALSTLGNMPELRHPKPVRASFHEILVQGYGNGLNHVAVMNTEEADDAMTIPPPPSNVIEIPKPAKMSQQRDDDEAESDPNSPKSVSSRWSKTDSDGASLRSSEPGGASSSSMTAESERSPVDEVVDQAGGLSTPHASAVVPAMVRPPSASSSVYEVEIPAPLQLVEKKVVVDESVNVAAAAIVPSPEHDEGVPVAVMNRELFEYLNS